MEPLKVPITKRVFTRQDLEIFNLLSHPVWVFDVEKKAMYWANTKALELWNANSLDDLVERDFASDMSDATALRLADYMTRFEQGEMVNDSWTYYPKGRQPTTVYDSMSGIYVENEKMMMLNDAIIKSEIEEEVDQAALRGVEMLRHAPVALSQFDEEGNLIQQNPEALNVFGSESSGPRRRKLSDDSIDRMDPEPCFLSRFVDKECGREVLRKVVAGEECCLEAEQVTKEGTKGWSSIKVRRSRDPVTDSNIILYSARDVTDLYEARARAEKANLQKSEFLAVMAHEIRTPLHQVIGFIELLSQTTQLTNEQAELVSLLQSSTVSLMAVINDLLDYSKLEAGKMDIESISFDIRGVVEGSLAAIESKAEEKGVRLTGRIEDGVPATVVGDPNRLRQILLNLLSNAVKFTDHGSISVSVSVLVAQPDDADDVRLRFTVQDTGIGISERYVRHIFDQYRQAAPSISRTFGGTGLGLSICKALTELMGGCIAVESRLGEGSKFSFELPYSIMGEQENERPVASLTRETQGIRVLVAEDNNINQKLIKAMLERLGHAVKVVENGQLAVEEAKEEDSYDLILMDLQMPVCDGLEATKRIRELGLGPSDLPIVGLTASFRTEDKAYYEEIGMNSCLGKPIRIKDLKAVMSDLVSSKLEVERQ